MGYCLFNSYFKSLLSRVKVPSTADKEEKFYTDDELCTLICGRRIFLTKITKLCKHSLYFETMFKCNMQESLTKRVDVKEMEPEVLETILNYIESSTLPKDISAETLFSVLVFSHMFLMQDLYECSWNLVKTVITLDSYEWFFELSVLHENRSFLTDIIDFIAENFSQLREHVLVNMNFEQIFWLVHRLRVRQNMPLKQIKFFVHDWIKHQTIESDEVSHPLLFELALSKKELDNITRSIDKNVIVSASYIARMIRTVKSKKPALYIQESRCFIICYSLRSWKWSFSKKIPVFNRCSSMEVVGASADHIYVYNRVHENGCICSLKFKKCNLWTGKIYKLPIFVVQRNTFKKFEFAAKNESAFLAIEYECNMKRHVKLYFHVQDDKHWKNIPMKSHYSTVDCIVFLRDSLFVYGMDSTGRNFLLERYNISSKEWFSIERVPKYI